MVQRPSLILLILLPQVRFYVRSMNGSFKMPSMDEMFQHWEQEKQDRAARGYTKRQAHMMGPDQVIMELCDDIMSVL